MEESKKSTFEVEFHKLLDSEQKLPLEKRLIRVFFLIFMKLKSPDELKLIYENNLLCEFSELAPKIAFERLSKFLELAREFDIMHTDIKAVEELLKDEKVFFHGKDKLGNPCLIIKAKKLFIDKNNIKTYMQMIFYNMQKGSKLSKEYFETCGLL